MKVAIYPGSFDPWHKGHEDVLTKALGIFDKVIIARGYNPSKQLVTDTEELRKAVHELAYGHKVPVIEFGGPLSDIVKSLKVDAVIKGLRNGQDFEYEKIQQYWNEDLGVEIPTFFIVSDRKLVHYSSSAIKIVKGLK